MREGGKGGCWLRKGATVAGTRDGLGAVRHARRPTREDGLLLLYSLFIVDEGRAQSDGVLAHVEALLLGS